jgi:hypothetical protein
LKKSLSLARGSRRFNRRNFLKRPTEKILAGRIIFAFEFHCKRIVAILGWGKAFSRTKSLVPEQDFQKQDQLGHGQ